MSFNAKLLRFFGSRLFLVLTLVLFVVEAAWIALSARYPQAFDEQFHFGIIRLYAHQLSPFFDRQPAGADQFGAVAADPSFLYHWLLSFPYRLIGHFTSDQTTQIIILRCLNIGLMLGALLSFRKVFSYTKASNALKNVVLFFFVATPVTPLLASQINYDNLIMLLIGLSVWQYLAFRRQLIDEHTFDWSKLCGLVAMCLVACTVKYAFLPVAAAFGCLVLSDWWRSRAKIQYVMPRSKRTLLAAAGLLVGLALFVPIYGGNMLHYHTPIPSCEQVISRQQCQSYAPWNRNQYMKSQGVQTAWYQKVGYPLVWLHHIMNELTFTIGSSFNDSGTVDYYVGTQLVLIEVVSWGIFGLAVLVLLLKGRWIWRQPVLRTALVISSLYILALLAQNWRDYISIGQLVAIHGRYLLPVLPLLYLTIALGLREVLRSIPLRLRQPELKTALASVLMLLLLFEGGGFVTYIMRSDPSWFWPQSSKAQTVNQKAKKILKPIVLDTFHS